MSYISIDQQGASTATVITVSPLIAFAFAGYTIPYSVPDFVAEGDRTFIGAKTEGLKWSDAATPGSSFSIESSSELEPPSDLDLITAANAVASDLVGRQVALAASDTQELYANLWELYE